MEQGHQPPAPAYTPLIPMTGKQKALRPPPLLPRAFRKRMSAQRLAEISLVHHINLDALAHGDTSVLLDYAASVLTWRNVADRLSLGQAEMQPQLELLDRLVAEVEAKGSLTLDEQDYAVACAGVVIMDLLASEIDVATAAWAAERSNAEVRRRFARAR
jgi:cytochrome P450